MQIQVDTVKAHITGTAFAHHRIQIGSVIIAKTARIMDDVRDLLRAHALQLL